MTHIYISIKVTDDVDFIDVHRYIVNGFKLGMYFLKMELSFEACRSELTVLSYMLHVHLFGTLNEKLGEFQ
jgi:hypothetical protein